MSLHCRFLNAPPSPTAKTVLCFKKKKINGSIKRQNCGIKPKIYRHHSQNIQKKILNFSMLKKKSCVARVENINYFSFQQDIKCTG